MALTPQEDAALGEVQLAHAGKHALAPVDDAVAGTVTIPDGADEKAGWRGTVTLKGKQYRVADEIGAMPLLMWASVAEMSTEDNGALAAIYNMLGDCVHEEHWNQFRFDAIKSKAKTEELLDVITKALEILTANPTESPSPASGGSRRTSGELKGTSSTRRARSSSASRHAS